MGYEIIVRESLSEESLSRLKIMDKKVYPMQFDEVEELVDFIRSKGKNAFVFVKPDKVELVLIDPSKDYRHRDHPDLNF